MRQVSSFVLGAGSMFSGIEERMSRMNAAAAGIRARPRASFFISADPALPLHAGKPCPQPASFAVFDRGYQLSGHDPEGRLCKHALKKLAPSPSSPFM